MKVKKIYKKYLDISSSTVLEKGTFQWGKKITGKTSGFVDSLLISTIKIPYFGSLPICRRNEKSRTINLYNKMKIVLINPLLD